MKDRLSFNTIQRYFPVQRNLLFLILYMLLTSLVLIPIIGILSIVVNNKLTIKTMKYIALTSSVINLFVSLIIFILFDFSTNQFQFVQEYHNISYFDFYLGIDGLSIYFVLLTTIIIPISLLSNWKSINNHVKSYIIIILLLESLLLLVFLVLDILLFYIFFESILPPLFILIGIFGSDNKIKASFYLFLYTLLGSLFLLLSILAMSSIMSATDFDTLFKKNFIYLTQVFLFYGIFIAFAVKTPTIFLNTWLLKAHVESPLGGSIILAAIVLKLSLYGILRLILPILPKAFIVYTYIIFIIGIITIIYASISTLRTIDVKELIAYSSVSHAAVYLVGIFSNSIQGIEGSISLGLGHGLVSPGLFIVAGGVLYDRFHTRLISFYKGMAQKLPLLAVLFFILCLANCGAPLTLNFVGEFLSLYGVFERSSLLGVFASSSIIFSAAYTIYMYQRISFGGRYRLATEITEDKIEEQPNNIEEQEEEDDYYTVVINGQGQLIPKTANCNEKSENKKSETSYPDLNQRETGVLFILTFFTVLLGISTTSILDGLHYPTSGLIYFTSDISDVVGFFCFFSLKNGTSSNLLPITPFSILFIAYIRPLFTLIMPLLSVALCVFGLNYFLPYVYEFYITLAIISCDAPMAWGFYFQDSASPQMEALIELHDNIMYYLVAILFAVGWIIVAISRNFQSSRSPISNKYLNHGTLIDLILTITPALILVLVAFPSFKLLYLMDEVTDPSLSVLTEGHQWYWSYEYPDFLNSSGDFVEFDSYLLDDSLTYKSSTNPNVPPQGPTNVEGLIRESAHTNNIANCTNHHWSHSVTVTPQEIREDTVPKCDFNMDRRQDGYHSHSAVDPAKSQYTFWTCINCNGVTCEECKAD